MTNQSLSENITTDATKLGADFIVLTRVMPALTFVETGASWILNAIVIRTLLTLTDAKLKVRFLIINAVASDMLLAGMLALKDVLQLAARNETNECWTNLGACIRHVIYDSVAYFSAFYQIVASIAVAFDRLYSVYNPLKYHKTSYNAAKKTAVLGAVFGVTICLSFTEILQSLISGTGLNQTSQNVLDEPEYNADILPAVLVSLVFFTIALYIIIFVKVAYYQRKRNTMMTGTANSQVVGRRHLSLSKTFFLINITYVLMYLPSLLLHLMRSDKLVSQPMLDYCLEQVTILLYLGNTIVDPLIYIFKVHSIRERLKQTLLRSATVS